MIAPTPFLLDSASMVAANKKQLSKISWKKKEAHSMADAIRAYFEAHDIPLVRYKGRETLVPETGREFPEWEELAKAYYMLRGGNRSIVAAFNDGRGNLAPMLMAHWYTRHRFCPVWNFRKSQLIRKKYREFLESHTVPDYVTGEAVDVLLIRKYTPIHMVLTLPHKGGVFHGQRFYARKLLHYFAEVRRCSFFKQWIYGGEYGLEIKKSSEGNGLHIHAHSLCFLDPAMTVNKFRDWLAEKWEKLTGATMCHFETLYYYKRDEAGQWIMTPAKRRKGKGYEYINDGFELQEDPAGVWARPLPKMVRKKHYIDSNSSLEDYLKGVMECIKYHFKNDSLKGFTVDQDGVVISDEWDVPLMQEILNNSRNLRFYSRYGAFYKQSALNFNNLAQQSEPEDENDVENEIPELSDQEQVEENIMATSENVESRLINPFTLEPARRDEYTICVVRPELLHYRKDIRGQSQLFSFNLDDFLQVAPGFELKEIIRAVCSNRAHEVTLSNNWERDKWS